MGKETVDAETLSRLDVRLNELLASLNDLIWQTRLQALLLAI